MNSKRMKVALVVLGALLICGLGGFLGVHLTGGNGGGGSGIVAGAADMWSLSSPVFAQSGNPDTTFLDEEAGITIYTNVGQSLNLATAKAEYKTIEKETPDYIVGSVSLPNLPEADDVHIFVHKDGWIVVYYLKAEPVSKVIDWNHYSAGKLTKTKLQVGLEEMCNALGLTATDLKYYHFQYPYASKWMIIVESQYGSGTDSCRLRIPSEFTVYERSWSHYGLNTGSPYYGYGSYAKIDGINISSFDGTATGYGQLTASQLSPDVFHEVSVSCSSSSGQAHVGILLLYQEP